MSTGITIRASNTSSSPVLFLQVPLTFQLCTVDIASTINVAIICNVASTNTALRVLKTFAQKILLFSFHFLLRTILERLCFAQEFSQIFVQNFALKKNCTNFRTICAEKKRQFFCRNSRKFLWYKIKLKLFASFLSKKIAQTVVNFYGKKRRKAME